MRVVIRDTDPHTYTPRAVIETDDGKPIAHVGWTAGYGHPDGAKHKVEAVATAHRFAASGVMLAALRELTAWAYGELAGRLAPEPVAAAKNAIAAAEGREIAGAPAILPGVPVIPVDALEWQEIGEEHQPKARLLAALQIGDCMFHVEAREIDPEADPQSTLECGDDFDKFGDIADQGDFATMTREGREYFVFILPYEA